MHDTIHDRRRHDMHFYPNFSAKLTIGVARIFSEGALFPKKLTTFLFFKYFLFGALKTQAETAKLTTHTLSDGHS